MVATRRAHRHDQLVSRRISPPHQVPRFHRPRPYPHPLGRTRRLPPLRNGSRQPRLLRLRRTLHFRQRLALAPARRTRSRLRSAHRFLPQVANTSSPRFSAAAQPSKRIVSPSKVIRFAPMTSPMQSKTTKSTAKKTLLFLTAAFAF